jgi:hypothetical protein
MPKTDLTNIMNMIKIEIDRDFDENDCFKGSLTFCWNDKDKEMCKIMDNDITGNLEQLNKKSLIWIKNIKEEANWFKGEKIWITIKNKGNYFIAFWDNDVNSKQKSFC